MQKEFSTKDDSDLENFFGISKNKLNDVSNCSGAGSSFLRNGGRSVTKTDSLVLDPEVDDSTNLNDLFIVEGETIGVDVYVW
jgi:hypothetical protein